MAALPTTLRLVPARGGAELRLSAVNATAYHASFELPPSLAPGAYRPVAPCDATSLKDWLCRRYLNTSLLHRRLCGSSLQRPLYALA